MLKLVEYSSWGTFFVLFLGGAERKNLLLLKKQTPSNVVECVMGVGIVTIMIWVRCCWGDTERKKFVTFEKTNSFKRGGVRNVGGDCYDNDLG